MLPFTESGCIEWPGVRHHGHGRVAHEGRLHYAHRLAYEQQVGPVPRGLVLDHLCRNPACVNPAHLEPVSDKENILRGTGAGARNARKTHCVRGHELAGDNLLTCAGGRRCRACNAHRCREYGLSKTKRKGGCDGP